MPQDKVRVNMLKCNHILLLHPLPYKKPSLSHIKDDEEIKNVVQQSFAGNCLVFATI